MKQEAQAHLYSGSVAEQNVVTVKRTGYIGSTSLVKHLTSSDLYLLRAWYPESVEENYRKQGSFRILLQDPWQLQRINTARQ